jgi:4-amino-4-deoxy-L-arabinose transferase-like glycosyltransferase
LFPPIDDGTFHPTAWVDPLYTFCLAALIWVFGPYHQLAAAIFNLCLLFAALMLTYKLGERLLNPPLGFLAVLILVSFSRFLGNVSYMNNTILASVVILASALALLSYLQSPSLPRAGVLGLILGVTALGCPGAQLFILVTPLAIVLVSWRERRRAVWQALTVAVIAVVILAPWTIRNYLVFDEFVPVRTGSGELAFVGAVAVSGTVDPDLVRSVVKPSWSEKKSTVSCEACNPKREA